MRTQTSFAFVGGLLAGAALGFYIAKRYFEKKLNEEATPKQKEDENVKHSGRYPWGDSSNDVTYGRVKLLKKIKAMQDSGYSLADIAKELGIDETKATRLIADSETLPDTEKAGYKVVDGKNPGDLPTFVKTDDSKKTVSVHLDRQEFRKHADWYDINDEEVGDTGYNMETLYLNSEDGTLWDESGNEVDDAEPFKPFFSCFEFEDRDSVSVRCDSRRTDYTICKVDGTFSIDGGNTL